MGFNKKNAQVTLADGGIPFLPEDLDGTKKLQTVEVGKHYALGRIGVIKQTLKFNQPFVAVELDGEFYTGYATAIGNQIGRLCEDEFKAGNTDGIVANHRLAYSEQAAEIDVYFEQRGTGNNVYLLMLIVE